MPGVYLSYPFCAQKCTYCNFASGVFPRDTEARYRDALLAEIRAYDWPWRPETVYLGGGTPGNLAPGALRPLLDADPRAALDRGHHRGRARLAHRGNGARLGGLRHQPRQPGRAVVRRTGNPAHRAAAHRRNRGREVALLREAGIANFNIDLIAGLSGQTEASWRESLDWIERLAPAARLRLHAGGG